MANKSLELKLKSYSTSQLESKLKKSTGEEKQIIESILSARKSKGSKQTEPKEVKAPKKAEPKQEPKKQEPAKEPKKPQVKEPKKESQKTKEVVTTSTDKKIQKLIDTLTTLEGKELEEAKSTLEGAGISVDYLDIVNKGDEVKFEAAGNSKYKGQTFTGTIVNNTDSDRNGKKYCKVRTEKYGTFQKQQCSLFVTSRSEE